MGEQTIIVGVTELLYQRFAAIAAVSLLLGGCSFFGFWDEPEIPAEVPKIDSQGPGGMVAGTQLAALPQYQSDQDLAPRRIEAIRGYVGSPPRRPKGATAAVQAPVVQRRLTFKDLLPQRQVLEGDPPPPLHPTQLSPPLPTPHYQMKIH